MPTYVYARQPESTASGCAKCRDGFETVQSLRDAALKKCPACGAPVRRVIQPPMVGNAGKLKGPSEKSLAGAGFTQYKRSGKGYYEKSFGKGPASLGG